MNYTLATIQYTCPTVLYIHVSCTHKSEWLPTEPSDTKWLRFLSCSALKAWLKGIACDRLGRSLKLCQNVEMVPESHFFQKSTPRGAQGDGNPKLVVTLQISPSCHQQQKYPKCRQQCSKAKSQVVHFVARVPL